MTARGRRTRGMVPASTVSRWLGIRQTDRGGWG